MFPYDRYAMKGTLHGELLKGWNLIPCKENKDRFKFLEPEKIKTIETRFPKAWKYLRKHEDKLEHAKTIGMQRKNKTEVTYGTEQQDLKIFPITFDPSWFCSFFRAEILWLSTAGTICLSSWREGRRRLWHCARLRGLKFKSPRGFSQFKSCGFPCQGDKFCFGGRFYSYADQFLKNLPVPQDLLNPKSKVTDQIDSLSGNLAVASEMRRSLLDKLAAFPESFEAELSRHELTTIARLCPGHPRSAWLAIDRKNISVERELFGFAVRYGSQPGFKFEYREHAECLAQALRNRRRRKLALQDVINWRFPVKPEGCKKLLALLDEARQELENMVQQTASEEEQLNDLVYKIYKVRPAERKIIEGFLSRFSSQAVG